MTRKTTILPLWLTHPEEHDYPAAASYLSLVTAPQKVAQVVKALQKAKVQEFRAKDIFRASGLSLLGVSNSHVKKDRKKVLKGTPLSPLLLVRAPGLGRVVIADGYHRLCAVYAINEDARIPCQIV